MGKAEMQALATALTGLVAAMTVGLAHLPVAYANQGHLVRTVILSRHGIRSPLPPPPRLKSSDPSNFDHIQDYSKSQKQEFPVSAEDWGFKDQEEFDKQYLTPHGAVVESYMGNYFYEQYGKTAGTDCKDLARNLFVVADNSTRDIQTANAFLDGFLQSKCPSLKSNITVHVSPKISRVFNCGQVYPDMGPKCRAPTEAELLGTIGSIDALNELWAEEIEEISDLIDCCGNATAICGKKNPNDTCTLADIPYEWEGVSYQLFRGPFERAGYFAEFLMLEALNGNKEVAWNKTSLDELERLYRIHVANMELQANEYSARSFGSDLLITIGALLRQATMANDTMYLSEAGFESNDKKIIAMFGHDTNIQFILQLLGMQYNLHDWPHQSTSTSGALLFELWSNSTSSSKSGYWIEVKYVTPSPLEERSPGEFEQKSPEVASISVPRCVTGSVQCPVEDFLRISKDAININCVADALKLEVQSWDPTPERKTRKHHKHELWSAAIVSKVCFGISCSLVVILAIVLLYRRKRRDPSVEYSYIDLYE